MKLMGTILHLFMTKMLLKRKTPSVRRIKYQLALATR